MQKALAALPSTLIYLALAGVVFFLSDRFLGGGSNPIFRWLLAAGLVTFACYGYDKAVSPHSGWRIRIREWTLHWLALSGGVIGGGLGMFLFNHKTAAKHREFRLILAIATMAWGWLLWRSL